MWIIAEYEPVTLFSLKHSSATASGGKTLLVPTPFAIKMALLDAACRIRGIEWAEEQWSSIRELQVALHLPEFAVISNVFQKSLRPRRNAIDIDEPDSGPFQRTIGYREYVHMSGTFGLGLGWNDDNAREWLGELLLNVNYFGKRGGFMQLRVLPKIMDELPDNYTAFYTEVSQFNINGTLQVLDDCSPKLTFEQVDIYSGKNMRIKKDRLLRSIVLPYRVERSSRGYTLYRRMG